MKILVELTYYRPHTSGLTIYAERLAKALVRRGHQVTILTSQYLPNLPKEESIDDVKVVRVPVIARVSKGVIMPALGITADKLIREHDVLHLHLPQIDAAGLALRGRIYKKPTVITYHCDLRMPDGFLSWAANQGVRIMNNIAALFTHRIVTYTQDYADHSKFLTRWNKKLEVVLPPVELPEITQKEIKKFGIKNNPHNRHPVIGIAARFATEKGIEILLNALQNLLKRFPNAVVWFAGPYKNIVGEEQYLKKLKPMVEGYIQSFNWLFLGELNPYQMRAFYKNLDILVVPSLNSTESFGLVQIEAMLNGTPVVVSDLPGVRQPVKNHHMGQIVPIGDSFALSEKICFLFENREDFTRNRGFSFDAYAPDNTALEYERIFERIYSEIQ